MPKVVMFNGPPGSGKDTAAQFFCQMFVAKQFAFAEELKNTTHAIFGINGVRYDHYETLKDAKLKEFEGMSPREAYIWVSEEVMKPKFGKDIWSQRLARKLKQYNYSKYAISDLGFDREVEYMAQYFGSENVSVVQMHRPGHDFKNDSRKYVEPFGGIKFFRIDNNQGREHLKKEVLEVGEALGL